MSQLPLVCLLAAASLAAADDFTNVVNSFGTTTTLIGTHQSATNDANGNAINFWQSAFEGGPALNAALSNPHMAGADSFGNVYIADKASHSILRIAADGTIHTFAGTHVQGFNGDGPAAANSLMIGDPNGLFVFPNGTVYLLDPDNHRIRKVSPGGIMTTVINDPDPKWKGSGRALWVSPDEQLIYYTNELAPVPPNTIADGAVVKKWTPANGIEVVCSKDVGFRNPGNIAVNPRDGLLYVCDRAEDDATKQAVGLFRIDGPEQRTRMTGNITNSGPFDGALALNSFIDQPRGIAFLPSGGYFICGHKDGSIWYVDTDGILHRYILGRASKDFYNLTDGLHPPLTSLSPSGQEWFSQPRAVTIAPNGNLLVVCNDSGFVFKVGYAATPMLPMDLKATQNAPDGLHLHWSGLFGRGYIVERSWEILSPDWQTVGAVFGDVAPSQFVDPATPGHLHAFYRLRPSM